MDFIIHEAENGTNQCYLAFISFDREFAYYSMTPNPTPILCTCGTDNTIKITKMVSCSAITIY